MPHDRGSASKLARARSSSHRIEADVAVRVALIDGHLEGNIMASEHVVLDSNARVAGNIYTPSLPIRDGAMFQGHSFLLDKAAGKVLWESETGKN
jgi:cytoskeletal protein CcmA (bactofilin family)